MPPQACLSPRSGVRRRKEGSERAVWRSGRPSRPTRIRPNPPNPGRMARFPSKTALQSAVEAVRIPSPYLHPSGKPAPGRPSNTPPKVPSLDEDPLEPLDFKPVTRPPAPLWTSAPLQGDRHAPESVIGMAELVIGIGGIRNDPVEAEKSSSRGSGGWLWAFRSPRRRDIVAYVQGDVILTVNEAASWNTRALGTLRIGVLFQHAHHSIERSP